MLFCLYEKTPPPQIPVCLFIPHNLLCKPLSVCQRGGGGGEEGCIDGSFFQFFRINF
jgi:hypothetical protein